MSIPIVEPLGLETEEAEEVASVVWEQSNKQLIRYTTFNTTNHLSQSYDGLKAHKLTELAVAATKNRTWLVLHIDPPATETMTFCQELAIQLAVAADLVAVCDVPTHGCNPARIMALIRNTSRRVVEAAVPYTLWALPAASGAVASRSQVQEFYQSLTAAARMTVSNFAVRDAPASTSGHETATAADTDAMTDIIQAEWESLSEAAIRKQIIHARTVPVKKRSLRHVVIVTGHTDILRNIKEAKVAHPVYGWSSAYVFTIRWDLVDRMCHLKFAC